MQSDVKAIKAHVAIHVRSVRRSIEFDKKLFGIEPSKVRHGYAKFDRSRPGRTATSCVVLPGTRFLLPFLDGGDQDRKFMSSRLIPADMILVVGVTSQPEPIEA